MKKTLAMIALAGLLNLTGCLEESAEIKESKKVNNLKVGQPMDYSLKRTKVEETPEYIKYRVADWTYVTVKRDTIVAIWGMH